MSAWLCGLGTLSLCVDVLKSKEFQEEYDIGDFADYSEDELLKELSYLNTKSLDCRYGKSVSHILEHKKYIRLNVSDAQRYKSVRCYLYQTCECDENSLHPLFSTLGAWSDVHEDDFEDDWGSVHWDIDNVID